MLTLAIFISLYANGDRSKMVSFLPKGCMPVTQEVLNMS